MEEIDSANLNNNGKVIAVCSAKGGIGRTSISVNLAVALTKKNLNVSVLDGDFQFGDVSLAMDIEPSFSIKDVMEELDGIDAHSISNYLTYHSSSVNILSAPERPEFADLVTAESLLQIIELLKQRNDYLIIDSAIGIQEELIDVVDIADHILVVTNLEMTALKNTKLMLETLEQLGVREKVELVINRYNMESLIEASDVPTMLGEEQAFHLPNNFKLASQSLNLGIPYVLSQAKSDISKAIFKMAESLTSNETIVQNKQKKKSVIPKLFASK